jgi:hypothetical protein
VLPRIHPRILRSATILTTTLLSATIVATIFAMTSANIAQGQIKGMPGACKTAGSPCVSTYHNDNARDGVEPNETVLTPSNVTPKNFGLLATATVDGLIYAQPLYLSAVALNTPNCPASGGPYNLVLVATQNNSVYAFTYTDTAGSFKFTQCWSLSLNGSNQFGSEYAIPFNVLPQYLTFPCNNIIPQSGITSTPVIDTSVTPPIMYVVSAHQVPNGNNTYLYPYRIHAILLNTGAEATGSPYDMSSLLPSPLTAATENQRPGLAMFKSTIGVANIYIGFGSYCDISPYSGYLAGLSFSYKTQTFAPIATSNSVFDTEEGQTNQDGGIWMGGAAPAVDSAGNVYVSVANGTWNGNSTRASVFGESVVKIASSTTTGLTAVDYYTPNDYAGLNDGGVKVCSAYGPNTCPAGYSFSLGSGGGAGDLDLGSGGVTLVSPIGVPNVCGSGQALVAGGKEGVIYDMCASLETDNTLQTAMGGWDGCGYACNGIQPSNEADTACTQAPTPGNGAIAQCFQGVNAGENLGTILDSPGIHGTEAFWAGSGLNYLYVGGAGTTNSPTALVAYQMTASGLFNTAGVTETTPKTYPWPGTVPVVSWNGSASSTGIVWALNVGAFGQWSPNKKQVFESNPAKPAILTAYQAVPQAVNGVTGLKALWESSTSTKNYGPGAVKFTVPTVANGFVFVPGGVSGYAPGLPGGPNVNCTASFLATSTTPTCQGMLSVYGQIK